MKPGDGTVVIVDDESSVSRALARLVASAGYEAVAFTSARDFLDSGPWASPRCLILDVQMPGISGLDLQREMRRRGFSMPIIFLTGHGSIPMSVRAMKDGAVDFLTKPVDGPRLLAAIELAVQKDQRERLEHEARMDIRRNWDSLTRREREVLQGVVQGRLNKQIAYDLGISEKTVKVHRARGMHKMKAGSLPELVRMLELPDLIVD
jgi:FixJ family two-component response regulator